jgi:hypothetical protein
VTGFTSICSARGVCGFLAIVAGVVYYFKSDAQGTHGLSQQYQKHP